MGLYLSYVYVVMNTLDALLLIRGIDFGLLGMEDPRLWSFHCSTSLES